MGTTAPGAEEGGNGENGWAGRTGGDNGERTVAEPDGRDRAAHKVEGVDKGQPADEVREAQRAEGEVHEEEHGRDYERALLLRQPAPLLVKVPGPREVEDEGDVAERAGGRRGDGEPERIAIREPVVHTMDDAEPGYDRDVESVVEREREDCDPRAKPRAVFEEAPNQGSVGEDAEGERDGLADVE